MPSEKLAVYWQSWSSAWTASPDGMDLVAKLDPRIGVVYICFAQAANMNYSRGRNSFSGTGLQFSQDFWVVKSAIAKLKARGVVVMLSVGGASYPFTKDSANICGCADLALDLGCSGIDIDWEPADPGRDSWQFGHIIEAFRNALWDGAKLSAAVWSTGAHPVSDGGYSGMNISGLKSNGGMLDWINIMAYDAGTGYDAVDACRRYRSIYSGPLYLGFCIGQQGWGGALLSEKNVSDGLAYLTYDAPRNGIFIWSYQKDPGGTPTVMRILDLAQSAFNNTPTPAPPPSPTETGCKLSCPNCGYKQSISSR